MEPHPQQATLEAIAADIRSIKRTLNGSTTEGNLGLVKRQALHDVRLTKLESVWQRVKWSSLGWAAGGGGLGYIIAQL